MVQTGRGRSGARALVDRLDGAKHRFDPAAREEKVRALRMLADRRILDPTLLIRFHEALCFLRAHPDDPTVLYLAEQLSTESRADDPVIARLQAALGVRAVLELVIVVAYYCCTTRVANVVRSDPFQFSSDG